jgi:hypothetical protein
VIGGKWLYGAEKRGFDSFASKSLHAGVVNEISARIESDVYLAEPEP